LINGVMVDAALLSCRCRLHARLAVNYLSTKKEDDGYSLFCHSPILFFFDTLFKNGWHCYHMVLKV
jgi:hypothetical protein